MEYIWITETLGAQVFSYCNIRRLGYLCEACIIYLCQIGLKFFLASMYTQIMVSHKILGFSDYF
jgi:hypothetical protein